MSLPVSLIDVEGADNVAGGHVVAGGGLSTVLGGKVGSAHVGHEDRGSGLSDGSSLWRGIVAVDAERRAKASGRDGGSLAGGKSLLVANLNVRVFTSLLSTTKRPLPSVTVVCLLAYL
jgi:hypothetical protein